MKFSITEFNQTWDLITRKNWDIRRTTEFKLSQRNLTWSWKDVEIKLWTKLKVKGQRLYYFYNYKIC